MKKIIAEALCLLQLAFFNAQTPLLYKDANQKQWVDSIYTQMSLEEKVGQLFIVAAYSNKDTSHEQKIVKLIENHNIGGLIFMQDNAQKQLELTNTYQQKSKIPLLIGMDAEWGLNMRLKNTHKFPYAMTLAAIQEEELVYETGKKIAEHCKALGVHWNFAPVVDVNTNPKNPIIGNRSFGSDVDNVSRKATAYMQGMQDNFILASAKHFPGHGDTSSDSHKTLPVVAHNLERLQNVELAAFQNVINNGVTGIMVAHLDVPNLEPNNIPSSLSYKIITEKLKNEMGFEGLIITDALNMQGVAKNYPPGIVDVKAFEAGNDILLFSQNVAKAKQEIIKKYNAGEITEERLEESVKKILKAKYFAGITIFSPLDSYDLKDKLNDTESITLTQKLYEKATTLVQHNGVLPFKEGEKIVFLPLGNNYDDFLHTLQNYGNVSIAKSPAYLQNQNIVIGVFKDTSSPYKSYKLSASEKSIIEKAAIDNKVTLVLFTSAYSLKTLQTENLENILVAYENNQYTQKIAPNMLFGTLGVSGRLPAEINTKFKAGTGYDLEAIEGFGYATPESQGFDSSKLYKVDEIAQKSIDKKETPGMQVLIARNGKIVYEKSFGYTDYTYATPVTNNLLYDLASVTKIAATLPMVMKMYEKKKISLNNKIGEYFPHSVGTDKEYITVREILLHNSGLKSWIPYYKSTLDEYGFPSNNFYRTQVAAQFYNPVAMDMYSKYNSKDYVYQQIVDSPIEPKTYDYSDLGFYILQYIIENKYEESLDVLLKNELYEKISANDLIFNPLQSYEKKEIAPTEVDNYYRKQTVQGYVHDQGAALIGGVAGHAGLFGNAKSVAKVMQLYLNGGTFNDFTFLQPETINYFTSYHNKSRRGLGFDKQRGDKGPFFDNAPETGFGHTGFTGTMVWADPATQLVFVFLSNRTYPDSSKNLLHKNKTRPRMLKAVYDAMVF